MSEEQPIERGAMHGEHTKKFYIWGTVILVIAGTIGGILLKPDDWHIARSIIAGVLIAVFSGYCVFAWHFLVGTIEEQ